MEEGGGPRAVFVPRRTISGGVAGPRHTALALPSGLQWWQMVVFIILGFACRPNARPTPRTSSSVFYHPSFEADLFEILVEQDFMS